MPNRAVTEAEINKAARTAGIPVPVLRAMLFRGERSGANATSPKGAYGQAQLMPGTARALEQRYGIKTNTPYGNVLGGAYYLAEQKKRFGSWRLAFAAYNAGPGAVAEYGGVPPYKETQDYVARTMKGLRLGAKVPAAGGGGVTPSSQDGSVPAAPGTAVPSLDPLKMSAGQGLRDLAEGDYDPRRALAGLDEFKQLAAQSAPSASPVQGVSQAVPKAPKPVQRLTEAPGGITYTGQKLTHDTDGLPGYPAVDLFAEPGTPFRAPESGRIVRLSGRGGTKGGYYGWSVYFKGDSGRMYYIQHLNKQRAKRGRYEAGAVLGTVSPWEGGSPHAHVGVKGGKK